MGRQRVEVALEGGDDGQADYTYDVTNQLTGADYGEDWQDDEDYAYDSNGNRVTANGDNYTTGENNQLLSDDTYAYLYDAEGNREYRFEDNDSSESITSGDTNIRLFVWDHRNRLVAVKDYADYTAYQSSSPSQVVEYAYDFGNRWVRKVLNPGQQDEEKTIFVYDRDQIALQFDKTGAGSMVASNLSHRYLWGTAVDQILADEQVTSLQSAGEVLWPLGDHLGSVRDVIDSSGTVKIHRVYDAYGNFTESPSTATHLFAFTARPFDAETLLQNNLHRWYDATVGRWLIEDPIGFAADNSNQYRYVGNHVLAFNDPLGLWRYVPGMGTFYGSLGMVGHRTVAQAQFILNFHPDKKAFKSAAKGTCCAEVSFLQIVKLSQYEASIAHYLGIYPPGGEIPPNEWVLDVGEKPSRSPYYDLGTSSDPRSFDSGMHDTPGLQSRWWQLLKDGSDFQLWYETSAICSKGQKTNSKQGVGDVFGCVEWSFSARFAGPSWNIRMAAWKLSFVSGSRWARETPSGRLRTTGVWGSGRLAWVIPVIGNPQEEKIGLNKDTYKFEEHQGKPPTGDMKDFLDILFP